MEKTIMCPVCGKEGIPDFRKEDVVCPCCGSDLSVYRKLDGLITISDKVCKPRGKSTMYWGLVVLLVVCSVCVVLKLLIVKKQVFKQEPTEYVNKQIKLLNDSIVKLNKKIESLSPDTMCIKDNIYVVKKGDSFCKISKKILGSEKYYFRIAELNKLQETSILYVGDTLKMPIK